jgi:hypothetical protein
MSAIRDPGRVAGVWYLLLILIGPLRLIYIPGKLFVPENAAATVNNIIAHEWRREIARCQRQTLRTWS